MDHGASCHVHGLQILQRRCGMFEGESVCVAQHARRIVQSGQRSRSRPGIRTVLQPAVQQFCSRACKGLLFHDRQVGEMQWMGCVSVVRCALAGSYIRRWVVDLEDSSQHRGYGIHLHHLSGVSVLSRRDDPDDGGRKDAGLRGVEVHGVSGFVICLTVQHRSLRRGTVPRLWRIKVVSKKQTKAATTMRIETTMPVRVKQLHGPPPAVFATREFVDGDRTRLRASASQWASSYEQNSICPMAAMGPDPTDCGLASASASASAITTTSRFN